MDIKYKKVCKVSCIKVIVVLIVLLMIVLILIFVLNNQSNNSPTTQVCSDSANRSLLSTDAKYIISNNFVGQGVLVHKIQKLAGYQNDPNCLYVIVNYYINTSNVNKAMIYYNKLKKIYDPRHGFSRYLNPSKTLNTLRNDITTDQANIKSGQESLIGMPSKYEK